MRTELWLGRRRNLPRRTSGRPTARIGPLSMKRRNATRNARQFHVSFLNPPVCGPIVWLLNDLMISSSHR